MGIEKIAGNGSMSYQGSATMTAAQQTESVVQAGGASAQTANQFAQTAGTYIPRQDFSVGTKDGENAERSDELNAMQGTQLKNAVSGLNKQMKNSEAVFGIHEKTNRVTIKIVDKTTKEVIKEFSPEETLDMIAKVWEIAGLMVDEKR